MIGFFLLAACQPDDESRPAVDSDPAPVCEFDCLEPEAQRPGDAGLGYREVIEGDYITCGIPWDLYTFAFGEASADQLLTDRTGRNAELPYYFTSSVRPSGVEVVASNCLTCHAGRINGELVLGLGAADWDFTTDAGQLASLAATWGPSFLSDPEAVAELDRWASRVQATAPYLITRTLGQNPANNLFAILSAHRDQDDLSWSDEPLMEPPDVTPAPADVPAWWHMKKTAAMFASGSGRGDHARIMMTAALLCTDTLEEAAAIDTRFTNVRAWIASLEAPAYPFTVDSGLAADGEVVFTSHCARCHGTYGEDETYPTMLVPLEEIGTDPLLSGGLHYADRFVDWYNDSYFGETSRLEPHEGYVAPPLDGVWATGPYLHNGSVPTVWNMLDSTSRPTFWTRTFDSTDLDTERVGWRFTELGAGQDSESSESERIRITDTTLVGFSNGGHTYGDVLTDDERWAVIEYLKTL